MYEESPTGMESNSSNDFVERLMNLPTELKQNILCSFTPKERSQLRLVNKAMLHFVDTNMTDVQHIDITTPAYRKFNSHVVITTVNPYNGAEKRHKHKIVPSSSLPFLLKWTGAQLKALDLSISAWIYNEDPLLRPFYEVFEALNSENTCPKLKHFSLDMKQSLWDKNEIILNGLLKYITKRQLRAKAADQPILFLHSLSLFSEPYPLFPVDTLDREKMRKFLQDILDQCQGLKELDVECLLVCKNLPIVALRYPTTLAYLRKERLGKIHADLQTIIENCPNLQRFNVEVGFPHDDANLRALPSLSDLRALTLESSSIGGEIVRMTAQCLAAFKDHPFGAPIARPWPQLKLVTLNCYKDEDYSYIKYRLLLSGSYCCITSLYLKWCPLQRDTPYVQSVEHLFDALISADVCSNLMDLSINSCELIFRIADSLATIEDREPHALEQQSDDSYDDPSAIPVPSPHVYSMLNDLLAYVTKRQSEVRLGNPFLHSLFIGIDDCDCDDGDAYNDLDELRDHLAQIHATVQQILDQCHGLEDLHIQSLEDQRINPNEEGGKELMKLVPLHFPASLKKLNGSSLD